MKRFINLGIVSWAIVAFLVVGMSQWEALAGKIYWVDPDANVIQRSNLDGSGLQTLLGAAGPIDIALDVAAGKMYWTDFSTNQIQRSNLDGSGLEVLVLGQPFAVSIALDVTAGKMYWTDEIADMIQRADLDGSAIETLVTGLDLPRGIALDVIGGKMYWVDSNVGTVQRADLDGSGVELLVTQLDKPSDIALDVAAGKMYWTDFSANQIQRANLNGSGVETLVSGLLGPRGIALDLTVTTYDVWTSRSVDFPPHEPIHDCVRLSETTISTDVCGDSGPLFKFPVLAVPDVDLWIGQVPCQGQNLFFVGTSLDGELFPLGKKAIGATIIGLSQGTTLGLEGLENANCSTSALNEDNTYATALSTGSQAVGELGSLLDDDKPALEIGPPGNAQTVANKTYEIWFSGSLGVPGAFPQSDCWHFTNTTMTTDQCGDSGPLVEFPLFGVPGMSLWIGQVPCQGQNLVFFGTSYDGAIFPFGGNVVSGTGLSLTLGLTLAAEGFENPSCSTVP